MLPREDRKTDNVCEAIRLSNIKYCIERKHVCLKFQTAMRCLLNTLVVESHVLDNNYFIPNLLDQQFQFCRSLRDAFPNEKFENYTYGYNFVPRSIVKITILLIWSR